MWVNCRSRVRLHVYAQHKRRVAYKGRYCGNCSQFILYMRWTGNLYEQQLKYMPAWITSDRGITVLMGKFMWMAKASKSVLNNTVRVNLFLLGHKVLSGCVTWKIRDDDDMKSREKFSENSILDHFLQQHLLFDHSRNYDILITIHISKRKDTDYILLDILSKTLFLNTRKNICQNDILRTMYVLRRITKMRIRKSNSLLASTSPWDTLSCCLTCFPTIMQWLSLC